ncbi:MAG: histidine kinase, gyrase and HSP90-like ATPase family protein [Anaerocolumna sp.]|jgi:signal transduction histidine kinase|nr:histidine kinase, gyrase and HSP90-like ATPase family protein [Anaerocolumna sp.]
MSITIFIVGVILSSMVSVSIILDFVDTFFERSYKNKYIYYGIRAAFILLLAGVNAINNSWLNILTVVIIAELISITFYSSHWIKSLLYIIIVVICMGACEAFGIALIHYIYNVLHITVKSDAMRAFFDMTITQVFVIFINHTIIIQILHKKNINELTNQQYFFTFIYAVFSVINIGVLSALLRDTSSEGEILFVLITIVGTVIINSQFLKILEYASENNRLQYENNLFLQQSKMQYSYYDKLEQQHRESLSILHDVKRHIRAIEELYRHNEQDTANKYAQDICNILDSFKLNEYTHNRVLNIILNDKIRLAEQNNIKLICKIDDVDLSFIDNIDLTTIFANLLDNAIEACDELKNSEKKITLQVGAFNNLVVINIKNPVENVINEHHNNLISLKKKHSGIGIPNVVKVLSKYNGDFTIQREGNNFVCNIVLSKYGAVDM